MTLRLLMKQHAESTVAGMESEELTKTAEGCLDWCNNMADTLLELPQVLVADMTRSNSFFPGLHSLLLGCAGLVYNGMLDRTRIKDNAMWSLCCGDNHPLIQEACEVLRGSQPGDKATFDGVNRCCFLLP